MSSNAIPAGYRRNAQGHLVPEETIAQIDKDRDALVREIIERAKELRRELGHFKERSMGDISAFVELAAERYEAKLGGRKGNVSLTSFDGQYRVRLTMQDRLTFDERIQAAKALVDECIRAWTQDSRAEIRALVEHAFQVDSEGRLNTARILTLLRLEIEDPTWRRAMDAIRDSIQVSSTRAYLNVYERVDDTDQFRQIALDLAAL